MLNLAVFALLAPAFLACKKEKSFKDELVGHWISIQVTAAGTDVTDAYRYDLKLESNQEFNLDLTTIVPLTGEIVKSYSGDWSEDEAKRDITLFYSDGAEKTWEVVSLETNALTAEIVENNIRYQVKFERN